MKREALKDIHKILFITLSNIGDAVLTTPVLSALMREFPNAGIDVVVGPRAREVFEGANYLNRVWVYDKHQDYKGKWQFIRQLKKEQYDLVVDLKHTLIPLFINSRYRTSILRKKRKDKSAVDDHLECLISLGISSNEVKFILPITEKEKSFADDILKENNISDDEFIIVIAPGAASDLKRWSQDNFKTLARKLEKEHKAIILWAGTERDREILSEAGMPETGIDLMGKTSLMKLTALLEKAGLMITNDSGPMHLARAVGTPVLALFGPTDYIRYGPSGDLNRVVRLELPCAPCKSAHCRIEKRKCLDDLGVEEVYNAALEMLHKLNIEH